MPILITIVACAVMVILQMTSSSFFGNQTKTYQKQRSIAERSEAVRNVGPSVREAFELYERMLAGGSTTCPVGTVRKTAKSSKGDQFVCWRNNPTDGACFKSREANPLWICPEESAANVFALGHLFLNSAYAAPIVLTATNPQTSSGVRLTVPACGPSAPCVQCSDLNTVCLTIQFCVSNNRVSTCTVNERVTQTFAFRR